MLGSIAKSEIDNQRNLLNDVCQKIWAHPETAFREYKACEWIAEALKNAGYQVETGAGGVPTAIKASWGSGKPIIGLLAEYDALPGLSQKVVTYKEPAEEGASGHGCGHNLMATATLGAALGIKEEMKAKNLPGTIIYYGCPAEEVLTGKVFMARGGVFEGLDCSISFHPNRINRVTKGSGLALNSAKFHFTGVTAHAGGDPHNGRSALDAVELTNVGANYLREHVPTDVRIHYVITEGGVAPNIVPDKATVWYYVRSKQREEVETVYKRLIKVAEGAAHMTETKLNIEFLGGCYADLKNDVLSKLIHQCMEEIPQEQWTDEEIAFAEAINQTMADQRAKTIKNYDLPTDAQLHTGQLPILTENGSGSTDVADVTRIAPGISFGTACEPLGVPGHSWQIAAAAGHPIGFKGAIYAAKCMALWTLKLMDNPEIVQAAWDEFNKCTAGKPYVCPIPPEVPVP